MAGKDPCANLEKRVKKNEDEIKQLRKDHSSMDSANDKIFKELRSEIEALKKATKSK